MKINPNLKTFSTFFLAFAFALGIGIYFRIFPLLFYSSSDSSEKATLFVVNKLKSSVKKHVDYKFAHLPIEQRNQISKKQFDQMLRKERKNVHKAIDKLSKEMDTQNQNNQKKHYLLASDSFYYFGLTKNIVNDGKISNEIKGSKYFHDLMMAPKGFWEPLNLHPFIGSSVYHTLKIFYPDIDLMHAVAFTPLFIVAFALVIYFFICYLLKLSALPSFISAVFLMLAPIYIKRSTFGWYDNDPYNILFPLLIFLSLFQGLNQRDKKRKCLFWGAVCGAVISLYSVFWHGWMFAFSIVGASGIASLIFALSFQKDKSMAKKIGIFFGSILGVTFAGVSFVFGVKEFFVLFSEGWDALKKFTVQKISLWPDMYIGIGELKKVSLPELIELTGGTILFLIALASLIFSIISLFKNSKKESSFKTIILTLFLLSSIYLTMGAQRFALFCIPPLVLFLGIGIDELSKWLKQKSSRIPPMLSKALISGLLLCLIIIPILHAKETTRGLLNPIFNETWDNTLTYINQNTEENSIVNAWWSPGHFIKAIAERRVTFDGATPNNPQAYWMSNVFLSQSEEEALGILRMLNNSGNDATDYLEEIGFKLSQAVPLLKLIVSVDKKKAQGLLAKKLDATQIETLLKYTHATPPPSYLLVYNEQIKNMLELSFIGHWNFKKIEKLNKNPDSLKSLPERGSKGYIDFLWSLVGGPLKSTDLLPQMQLINDTVMFNNNIAVNLKTMTCKIKSKKYGKGIPQSIFYLRNNVIVEKKLSGANLGYSVLLVKEGATYKCMLLDKKLANSFLVKLFFFKGRGLKNIRPFHQENDLTHRTQILTYKIDW